MYKTRLWIRARWVYIIYTSAVLIGNLRAFETPPPPPPRVTCSHRVFPYAAAAADGGSTTYEQPRKSRISLARERHVGGRPKTDEDYTVISRAHAYSAANTSPFCASQTCSNYNRMWRASWIFFFQAPNGENTLPTLIRTPNAQTNANRQKSGTLFRSYLRNSIDSTQAYWNGTRRLRRRVYPLPQN